MTPPAPASPAFRRDTLSNRTNPASAPAREYGIVDGYGRHSQSRTEGLPAPKPLKCWWMQEKEPKRKIKEGRTAQKPFYFPPNPEDKPPMGILAGAVLAAAVRWQFFLCSRPQFSLLPKTAYAADEIEIKRKSRYVSDLTPGQP